MENCLMQKSYGGDFKGDEIWRISIFCEFRNFQEIIPRSFPSRNENCIDHLDGSNTLIF